MPQPNPSSAPQGWLNSSLGLLQFLFLPGWIVYIVFLPDLLAQAGLAKEWTPRLLLDQIVFAAMVLLLELYADRLQNLPQRLTPLLLTLNLLSCLILASLPFIAGLGPLPLIADTVFWVASSTVLRAPLYGAIARRNALGATAWSVAGQGLASAAGPYLGAVHQVGQPTPPLPKGGLGRIPTSLTHPATAKSLLSSLFQREEPSGPDHQVGQPTPSFPKGGLGGFLRTHSPL